MSKVTRKAGQKNREIKARDVHVQIANDLGCNSVEEAAEIYATIIKSVETLVEEHGCAPLLNFGYIRVKEIAGKSYSIPNKEGTGRITGVSEPKAKGRITILKRTHDIAEKHFASLKDTTE
ncbi:hypothetical protein Q5427_11315 [Brochothrix thermosphacta]|uniref:hypothetical protein n=1 Tax=Brochothrix thermosphacta TaxID=2756 RepID=UPI00271322B2|nr:hypothetical protein [Brochothrix thermosphacta]MDO7864879.1 hypothetical protein [Brochothrix thermosphacta]